MTKLMATTQAGYWPSQTGTWADRVNALPKFDGSTTLTSHSPDREQDPETRPWSFV